jgi:hypothetical protein
MVLGKPLNSEFYNLIYISIYSKPGGLIRNLLSIQVLNQIRIIIWLNVRFLTWNGIVDPINNITNGIR